MESPEVASLEFNKSERDEIIARWQRCRREAAKTPALDRAVSDLIEEACAGVASGRVDGEHCGAVGDAIGRAWRELALDPAGLIEELVSARRSVWDMVSDRFRTEALAAEALLTAREIIDTAFDHSLRRAVAAATREPRREGEGAEPLPASPAEGDGDATRAHFHAALNATLADATLSRESVSLVVLHIDVRGDDSEARALDDDLVDLSEILNLQLRQSDREFRLTGSDYAIICSATDGGGARKLLDRITYAVGLYARKAGFGANITGGYAVAPDDGLAPMDLIRVALADREFSIPGGLDASRV